jgi:hypothetical protein
MKFLKIAIPILFLLSFGCKEKSLTTLQNNSYNSEKKVESSSKISILNFGTFHFGNTSDANKTEFDEND